MLRPGAWTPVAGGASCTDDALHHGHLGAPQSEGGGLVAPTRDGCIDLPEQFLSATSTDPVEVGTGHRRVNVRLIGLAIDRDACLQLVRAFPPVSGEQWIAASGMSSPQHLKAAAEAGYHAALVGSALMENGTPGEALAALLCATAKNAGDCTC